MGCRAAAAGGWLMISSQNGLWPPPDQRKQLSKPIPLDCRPRCGACCTAPSISSPIPGMPHGKPAGVRCIQLGLEGNDTLDGGLGADSLSGGLGNDTYLVNEAGDLVLEGMDEGTDRVLSAVTWTLGAHLEDLTLTGAEAIQA